VSLALYVAFWLELDNPVWAGTSAAIVCQPHLGASLRKGWYRMIGTLVGAVASVVLTACFPQDRMLFLGGLALWGSASALAATLRRNFASYSAALAGYTAAIVGSDLLGTTGGVNADAAFLLAVSRGSEIIIGIVCAGIVLAATNLGDAPRRLAPLFAATASEIADRFIDTLTVAGANFDDIQRIRSEFVRRVIAAASKDAQHRGQINHKRKRQPVALKGPKNDVRLFAAAGESAHCAACTGSGRFMGTRICRVSLQFSGPRLNAATAILRRDRVAATPL
jgi:uncharacterized membrane protein YccC